LSGKPTLEDIILGCVKANRDSQKQLYKLYYSFSMGICMRYSNSYAEAEEITNDGFLKIFKKITDFEPSHQSVEASFAGWIKRIFINTAIDNYRKNNKSYTVPLVDNSSFEISETAIDTMSYKEIIELVQKLSPTYRTIFNLYVLDGYKHEEISKQLNISVGTSKSNLAKARMNIQKMLQQKNTNLYEERKAI
jgi:RNA polymerase sigma factor (sigma-70 family)